MKDWIDGLLEIAGVESSMSMGGFRVSEKKKM